jgi:hypothetical protein
MNPARKYINRRDTCGHRVVAKAALYLLPPSSCGVLQRGSLHGCREFHTVERGRAALRGF